MTNGQREGGYGCSTPTFTLDSLLNSHGICLDSLVTNHVCGSTSTIDDNKDVIDL